MLHHLRFVCVWSRWHVYIECWYRSWSCKFIRDVMFLYPSMCNQVSKWFILSKLSTRRPETICFEIRLLYNFTNSNATTVVPFDHLTRNSAKRFRTLYQIICENSVDFICQRRWYSTPTNSCCFFHETIQIQITMIWHQTYMIVQIPQFWLFLNII